MRGKSEYPARHGDQHAPDGSDPIAGIGGGLQYNVVDVYGPHNIGDWLNIETTGTDPDTSYGIVLSSTAGGSSGILIDTTNAGDDVTQGFLQQNSGFWGANTYGGIEWVQSNDASGVDFLFSGPLHQTMKNWLVESVDVMTLESGDNFTMSADGYMSLEAVEDVRITGTDVNITLAVGSVFTIKDHLGAAKIQWTEGTTAIHIPTSGTIVADL